MSSHTKPSRRRARRVVASKRGQDSEAGNGRSPLAQAIARGLLARRSGRACCPPAGDRPLPPARVDAAHALRSRGQAALGRSRLFVAGLLRRRLGDPDRAHPRSHPARWAILGRRRLAWFAAADAYLDSNHRAAQWIADERLLSGRGRCDWLHRQRRLAPWLRRAVALVENSGPSPIITESRPRTGLAACPPCTLPHELTVVRPYILYSL